MELGKGNVSVLILRKLTQALGCSVSELFWDWEGQLPEAALTWEMIKSVPGKDQKALRELIVKQLGVDVRKQGRLALIGLRGAGKTTLGKMLARKFNVPFIRLVSEIEKKAGIGVNEIFSLSGQSAYRRLELEALEEAVRDYPRAIIEAGGSLVSEAKTFNRLLVSCFTVWVKTSPSEHMNRVVAQGDFRPMENNKAAMADLKRILAERGPYYKQADASVDTSNKSADQSSVDLEQVCREQLPLLVAG